MAIIEALFPGKRMKVASVDWNTYDTEVTIKLEEDDEHTKAAEQALGTLGGRTPPAPGSPKRAETTSSYEELHGAAIDKALDEL